MASPSKIYRESHRVLIRCQELHTKGWLEAFDDFIERRNAGTTSA
jgi:hypothetical protein